MLILALFGVICMCIAIVGIVVAMGPVTPEHPMEGSGDHDWHRELLELGRRRS